MKPMRSLLTFIVPVFLAIPFTVKGQEIPVMEPTSIGRSLDFSPEFVKRYNSAEAFKDCQKVYDQMKIDGRDWNQLTAAELDILKFCDEVKADVWDPVGDACSWYCGGGPSSITASSHLTAQGTIKYVAKNAHDFSYKNAWVEGVEGYGVGEYLTYMFAPESPRITEIIVVNGYVKTPTAWQENSRVKTLQVYYNETPLAILKLRDVRAEQRFKFDPIGDLNRESTAISNKKPQPWSLKFEILEVYKGSKYSDTVISEIYFDGIDVH